MSATRVLIVEDDHAIAGLLSMLLREEGYAVDVAADGATALHLMRGNPTSCVLVDLGLPLLSGVQLIETLKQRYHDLSIVLISAQSDIGEVAERLGAKGYIAKPFNIDDVGKVMRNACPPQPNMQTNLRYAV